MIRVRECHEPPPAPRLGAGLGRLAHAESHGGVTGRSCEEGLANPNGTRYTNGISGLQRGVLSSS